MEGLSGTQLLDAMQPLICKGITSGRKGYEKIIGETRSFRDEKLRFEEENLLTVKIRQPSHEFTFGVGMSFIPYPLVLTPVV
jgi:hypothetical protein